MIGLKQFFSRKGSTPNNNKIYRNVHNKKKNRSPNFILRNMMRITVKGLKIFTGSLKLGLTFITIQV